MVTENRETIIQRVLQWYKLRHSLKPYYKIVFGEIATEKGGRTFSSRAWGEGEAREQKVPTDQFVQWLRSDLEMMPGNSSYVVVVRRNGSDNRGTEEFPFYLPADSNQPANPALTGPPTGYLSREEVNAQIEAAVGKVKAEFETQQLRKKMDDLEKENKELKKKSDFIPVMSEIASIGKHIITAVVNKDASAISGAEKKNPVINVDAETYSDEKIEEMDDLLEKQLERLLKHMETPEKLVEALTTLNDKLDDPSMKQVILGFL